jgi:hypothetical protein
MMHQAIDTRSPIQERADDKRDLEEKNRCEYLRAVSEMTEAARGRFLCRECGRVHPDGDAIEGCDMVFGRRGWRQLGTYDG